MGAAAAVETSRRHHVQRTSRESLSFRASVVAIACAVILAAVPAAASATAPGSLDGVEYGWVNNTGLSNDYGWLRTSDAALVELGAGGVAGIACDAIFHDSLIGTGCKTGVRSVIRSWIGNVPSLANHGFIAWFYPWRSPHAAIRRF